MRTDVSTLDAPAPSRTTALSCHGLVKRYGTTVAVDGVDLEVQRGSLTALLGPSGCGKTTVLRMLAGLLQPDAGEIRVDDRLVDGDRTHVAPERRSIGLVFQDYALFPHLSVARNVAYGLSHLPRRERRARVVEVLELVGLRDVARRLPTALSGGQQQRVALARALAPSPDLVLLDEPFSNLDAALRATVREEVRGILHAAGATAIFVTHDQEEALSLADRVAVMEGGRIHQVDEPQTLYTRPATRFVAEFVGEADVLPARRAGARTVTTSLGELTTTEAVPANTTAALIRPEAVVLSTDGPRDGTVTSIEYFGHDQLVHVGFADGSRVRSRRGPTLDLHRGDRVSVHVVGPVSVFA